MEKYDNQEYNTNGLKDVTMPLVDEKSDNQNNMKTISGGKNVIWMQMI